jgi:hypothetical protein
LSSTRVSETFLAGVGLLVSFDFDFINVLYCIARANVFYQDTFSI